MSEDNDLEFKSKKDNIAHCCGHDIHTAMLLGVAKILKDNESSLNGIVKFMFQPNEEGGGGAFDMIEDGILSNPKVDSVFAVHVDALTPMGKINYGYGSTFASNDNMDIRISGKSSHGARPHEGIDPINIAFQLYNLFQSYMTREKSPMDTVIFSVTSISSGNSYNIVPDFSLMKATLRTYSESVRKNTLGRFKEMADSLASMYNTKIDISINSSIPPLVTDKALTDRIKAFIPKCLSEKNVGSQVIKMGSEDFSYITEKIPNAAYFFIGAGKNEEEGYEHGQHTSKVIFNEDCMCIGVAFMSYMAIEFFKDDE